MMLYNIYFSAKGTTETCAACIGRGLNMEMKPYNWTDCAGAVWGIERKVDRRLFQ